MEKKEEEEERKKEEEKKMGVPCGGQRVMASGGIGRCGRPTVGWENGLKKILQEEKRRVKEGE